MLKQYRLRLIPEGPCHTRPEWAYHLYGALLSRLPRAFAEAAHQDAATPLSQYLQLEPDGALLWTVNLLGGDSEAALSAPVEALERLELNKEGATLRVAARAHSEIPDADALLALAEGHSEIHAMRVLTSAAFKSRGQYVNLPTPRLLLQSLVRQWNGCVKEVPIEDEDEEGMETMAAGLRFRQFSLRDRMYYLKGRSIPGFIGSLTVENRLKGFHRTLANALLLFSDYSGIGIKTTLGMGGVRHS